MFNNFVRLTPDRPNKNGYIYANEPYKLEDFVAYMRFRVSGKSETLGGDGFAFWFIAQNHFRQGMIMGGKKKKKKKKS